MNDRVKQVLSTLPTKSGVYIMHDEYKNVLYVGKAKNLKNRVRQYFHGNNRTEKTLALVARIEDINYIITPTELDALVLENNLIKEHSPPYNIMLKDDKTYPYIKINVKHSYPTVEITRRLKPDGARYFGPYMLGIRTSELMGLIHSAFPLRECKNFKSTKRACLNYHMGRCLAPCVGKVTKEEYREVIKKVIAFLSGSHQEIEKTLTEKMYKAAEAEEFETAKHFRDMLDILQKMVRKQSVPFKQEIDLDIFSYVTNGLAASVNLTVVRGGKLLGGSSTTINDTGGVNALSSYIMQYYEKNPLLCSEVVTSEELEFSVPLQDYLSSLAGRKINVYTPIGGIRKQLADISVANAAEYLEKQSALFLKKEDMTLGAVKQLQELLGLGTPPIRIECYDISHISGTNTVSSMAVFINGDEAKKHYRHFRIETVRGIDDFASMKETLLRRLNRLVSGDTDTSFSARPDLIIIDGGKGQLSSAVSALEELSLDLNIVSLAKREEEVFLPGRSESILLPRDSLALKLIVRIRDEAHRFAVSYHRRLREKMQTMSELKKIEGVGEATSKQLLAHFKNMNALREASVEEIERLDRMSAKTAQAIYDYFKAKREED